VTSTSAGWTEPVEGPTRLRRLSPPLLLAGGVLVASVALHVRDPHRSGSWAYCPWLLMTGTYCPGCGGLRAVNDLTRGDLAGAASSNLLFVASIPALLLLWVRSVQQRWRGVRRPWPARVVGVNAALALTAVVAFWVVRNLPFAGWLTP
jgi:hypothetical protein